MHIQFLIMCERHAIGGYSIEQGAVKLVCLRYFFPLFYYSFFSLLFSCLIFFDMFSSTNFWKITRYIIGIYICEERTTNVMENSLLN
jgi:hypothetical protein